MSQLPSNDEQKFKFYQPEDRIISNKRDMSQTMSTNQFFRSDVQKKTQSKQLSTTISPRSSFNSIKLLDKNKKSPYLEPINGFGNSPPPPPLLKKNRANPSLIQPIRPAKIYPPNTPRSPRKYTRTEQDDIPYPKRFEWKTQSETNFFNQINLRYQQTKQLEKIYSTDYLKQRQLSIERVSAARKRKEVEERKQRIQKCKDHQESVQYDEKHERFYNDEIY